MEIRHSRHYKEVERFNTEELRENFLVQNLFVPGELKLVYSHEDRMIVGGACPTNEAIKLDAGDALRTEYFLERREIGIVNIGGAGLVTAGGKDYELGPRDCLYVGKGVEEVLFKNVDEENPAKFYLMSTTAHKEIEIQKMSIQEATPNHLGAVETSNKRTIYQYIHAGGLKSCQLMLGMTILEDNSLWNTMPAHVHDRRSEIYLYFDMKEDTRVFHFMGKPDETRHLVMKNEEVVISPPYSIHSGVATGSYTFIWAMGGENYTFTDMDAVAMDELK
ncbi:5-dehydro-4-deoxy-D-glucuronate isomerase [Bacillus sp. FJAT-50079]|uniref:5-dehydro-4-deoxy-D-glucuronate isomerase n=1 Tax=Bacillus sp. FJAT-50079 TaxID=2833577 RepID=UPI001BC98DC2|nr:5-dehydro-4-deoxy-D-glucuronate isomerase [Bacillus sp. FJAT-50079]MBS4210199.1 5-dehydro-4-deoxy-D-glucuronate isomerase [Bacillus sp. FJAT-50079]